MFASESIQESTWTKSETKLGMEHLKIASLPTIMLSGEMLISYLWLVTETKAKELMTHAGKGHEGMLSYTTKYFTHKMAAKDVSLRINPRVNCDKVSDKAWHRAFENCIISNYDTLTKDVNLEMLICH